MYLAAALYTTPTHGLFRPVQHTCPRSKVQQLEDRLCFQRRQLKRGSRLKGRYQRAISRNSLEVSNKRTFKFVEYGEEHVGSGNGKSICCDGLVRGADLHLTHWTGNSTPEHLYADTSTEIALNFNESDAASSDEWASALVLNNHFDSDGVLSVWTLLHPEEARQHRELLVAGAAAGDFEEWPREERGVKLDAALGALAVAAAGEGEAAAYHRVLPQVGRLLADLDRRQDLWGDAWQEVELAEQQVARGEVEVVEENGIGVILHRSGTGPVPALAASKLLGGPFTGIQRLLFAFEEKDSAGQPRFRYTYSLVGHGWVRTVERPNATAPDKDALAKNMGAAWAVLGGLNGIVQTTTSVPESPLLVIAQLVELDEQLKFEDLS